MYKKAIDLLIGMSNVEKKKLVVELAKHHPSIFIKLVGGKGKEEEKVVLENDIVFIINAIHAGRRAEAVKGIQEHFGHSFNVSVEIVHVYSGDKDIILSNAQKDTLNNLKRVAKVLKIK